ncbi:hypothetical protein L5B97_09645 [Avibacterium sp. 20-15]|uniref:hypothetical protein n=1 Tax=unclassified Avibacterium TaxID=2685287 RepID=UPI002026B41B|nr:MULTISPECIES: hypothetical protein [unclassified Avibacterium]MCW9733718.1 hypothetical protein [Avibacterium sp. 20-15]URL03567.1 hypothetical protein L4F93_08335 [Avibacterium sp. 20-132]
MLEQAIQENTAAVNKLCELFTAFLSTSQTASKQVTEADTEAETIQVEPETVIGVNENVVPQIPEEPQIDFVALRKQVSKATIELAKINRDRVKNLLTQYGAENVKGLKDTALLAYQDALNQLQQEVTNAN